MGNFKEDLKKVRAFAFDVDGVFASSLVLLNADGEMLRTMNIKDGYVIQYAIKKGFPIAIISGGGSNAIIERFKNLGVKDIYVKILDKEQALLDFAANNSLDLAAILYMGDDIPDLGPIATVGFPTCPADAVPEIKELCCYISDKEGGKGCVRDVVEQVLKVQGLWMDTEMMSW